MGSPKDEIGRGENEGQHNVTISKPFYMGIYPVTQEQYEQAMGKNPSCFKGKTNPVEMVSWDDAVKFCKALSRTTGRSVRLPTEAEWEYACRAGTTTPFNTGNTISTDQANYQGDSIFGYAKKGLFRAKTTPVDNFKPNAWGIFDMHGNVFQWCSDWADDYAKSPNTDPQGPKEGKYRIMRGGSWNFTAVGCRSASRDCVKADSRQWFIGFRVVVVPDHR